jgi:hypothetical protein
VIVLEHILYTNTKWNIIAVYFYRHTTKPPHSEVERGA